MGSQLQLVDMLSEPGRGMREQPTAFCLSAAFAHLISITNISVIEGSGVLPITVGRKNAGRIAAVHYEAWASPTITLPLEKI